MNGVEVDEQTVEKEKMKSNSAISDYAMIGNLRTCALVSRSGSIDWFCPGRFDAEACFAALLGTQEHGRWFLGPEDPAETSRRYSDESLVLETIHTTRIGTVRVTDFMPVHQGCHLIRSVTGVKGSVQMQMECIPRFGYGRDRCRPVQASPGEKLLEHGAVFTAPDNARFRLTSDVGFDLGNGARITSDFVINAGETRHFIVSFAEPEEGFHELSDVSAAAQDCNDWWQRWVHACSYEGPWRGDVVRSMITLKALIYEPNGSILAAPTTSLPEVPGGGANWDYRYSWVRDAALVLDAFLGCKYYEEAQAWWDWLLPAVNETPALLHTLFTIDGSIPEQERELDWLPGYRNSRPVRVGNAASRQYQLDLRGELIEVLHLARRHGIAMHPEAWQLQCQVLAEMDNRWREPDAGIWETRGEPEHFTHSKVFAWVAYDRSIRDAEAHNLDGPCDHWRRVRDEIRDDILNNAVHPRRGCFTRSYGSEAVDASLLMIALTGFLPADDPRIKATIAAIETDLCRDGLVYRNRVSAPGRSEGAFLPCCFWLADNYLLAGREEEAQAMYERLLSLRNDVGLMPEEYDPVSNSFLGNFPQSFTHLELVSSARLIGGHERVERSGRE